MRYLRMLSNSVFAGLLAAVYISVLALALNPSLPLTIHTIGTLLAVGVLAYGLHIAVVSYALYVLRQIALVEPSSPGWISLRLVTWSAAALSGTAAVIVWLHATGLRASLERGAVATLTSTAALFATTTGLFLILGLAQIAARPRLRATVAVLFTVVVIVSIVGPFVVRGHGVSPLPAVRASMPEHGAATNDGPRVVLLCLDGASLDVISPAVAAGRLPNFARLLERGASMHLETARPTQAEPGWASVMTGTWPARHGVRGAAKYRLFNSDLVLDVLPDYVFSQAWIRYGLIIEEPYSSESFRAQPLWRMAARYGVRTGLIGLPLTHPAEPPSGFIVSDRFHRRNERSVLESGPAVSPAHLDDVARTVSNAQASSPSSPRVPLDLMPRAGEPGSSIDADRVYHALARELDAAEHVRLLAVRYTGLDAVGHYYLRFAQPEEFGDVSDDERRRFGRVLEEYYDYVDDLVGDALAELRADDLLVVVSGFGMEAQTPGKRLLERLFGDPRFSGTHERGPDGFLLAYGTAVAPARQPRGALVDVAPTLLYFLGLPVARDMDGFARTEIFTSEFNSQHTITFIPSYDEH